MKKDLREFFFEKRCRFSTFGELVILFPFPQQPCHSYLFIHFFDVFSIMHQIHNQRNISGMRQKNKYSFGSSISDSLQRCEELSVLRDKTYGDPHKELLFLAIESIKNLIQEFYVPDEGDSQNTINENGKTRHRIVTRIADAMVTSNELLLYFTMVTRKEREMIESTIRLTHLLARDQMIFESITPDEVSARLHQQMLTQPKKIVEEGRINPRVINEIMNQMSCWDLQPNGWPPSKSGRGNLTS
jgi:hypothetical protein